jgi:CBS-domain-containing membrane protein
MTQDVRILVAAWIACAVTVAIALLVMELQHVPWLLASLGGSCVIVFGMPDSKMAQPRSLLGGHLIGSLVGLGAVHLLGAGWLAMAAATATALILMMLTDSIHSPAGADPLIVMSTQASWSFLVAPLGIGLLIVFLAAAIYHRAVLGRPYPARAASSGGDIATK